MDLVYMIIYMYIFSLNIHNFISICLLYKAVLIILFSLYLQSRKKTKKGDNLDDLKQELDIDFHKISVEELYQRFSTNPDTVSITVQNIWHSFCLLLYQIVFSIELTPILAFALDFYVQY
jgi:hypothetical protein